ncbi:HupE/UreJ family protein [Thetidibacter halocola]|uniref:HupE/UreJ family protein n=1 Tax=Thetidibacter halocola TaxID=2827239 RepID=A0A8J8B6D9_9RHOB|nr:HupE/UreJ family protein [Thetidibacter halocola]MBS0122569.1 HupE/UreJ family protein [Thetidibacter halocola]
MRLIFGLLIWIATVAAATAHEVRPAIGDLATQDGVIRLDLRLNAEALLAGIDLEGVEDTNETDGSDAVDALRALPADEIAARLREAAPGIIAALGFAADGAPMDFTVADTIGEPVGNVELPRETVLRLEAPLPPGTASVEMSWPARYGTLILRQIDVEDGYTGYLAGDSTGPIAVAGGDAKGALGTFAGYIPVGFDHILPKGLDHILFVLGLFFLSTRMGPLLWQVSAFTLAHTVTLALGALGYVTIPGSIVEPIIAASIVYVAVENIVSDKLHRWRPAVIFVFGLLHGLGFASVLQEFGLPEAQFVPALIGFNVGVEFGQLTVIAGAFLLVALAQRVDRLDTDVRTGQVVYGVGALLFLGLSFALNGPGFVEAMGAGAPTFFWPLAALCVLCALAVSNVDKLHAYRRFVAMPASLAIACVGAWWFVERVFL